MAGIVISAVDINKVVSCKCRFFVSVRGGGGGGGGGSWGLCPQGWLVGDPTTKRFIRTLIYFNMDTPYANLRGNPLYQATKRHLHNR